jgi:putative peptidoglycan binding protein
MLKISKSVGKGGKNEPADVTTVQTALNKAIKTIGVPKLKVDGLSGKKTENAIKEFQKTIGLKKPDGRIDPGKNTAKMLDQPPKKIKEAGEAAAGGKGGAKAAAKPGKLSGKTQGVNPKVLNVLTEVAAHYGRNITASSGKRDAKGQAKAMWNNWTGNLNRGYLYTYLSKTKAEREYLDQMFENGDKAAFTKKVLSIAPKLSMHLTGEAIDIAPKSCLTKSMLKAIKLYLRVLPEKSCYHIDTKGKSPPGSISDKDKAKWPA